MAITTSPDCASFIAFERSSLWLSTITFSVGEKRFSSLRQLGTTDAGAITSEAPSLLCSKSNVMVCNVLPSPISSAKQTPAPHAVTLDIHSKPSS